MLVGEDVKLLDFGAAREFADERSLFSGSVAVQFVCVGFFTDRCTCPEYRDQYQREDDGCHKNSHDRQPFFHHFHLQQN